MQAAVVIHVSHAMFSCVSVCQNVHIVYNVKIYVNITVHILTVAWTTKCT